MKNNNTEITSKQSFEDILRGEEPTEVYLEEFKALYESEQISDDELTRLALASKADLIDSINNQPDPNYKTNESGLSNIFIIAAIISIAIYSLIKLLHF